MIQFHNESRYRLLLLAQTIQTILSESNIIKNRMRTFHWTRAFHLATCNPSLAGLHRRLAVSITVMTQHDIPEVVRAIFAANGRVGGKTTGSTKSRGDSKHYAKLARKAAKVRRTNRKNRTN